MGSSNEGKNCELPMCEMSLLPLHLVQLEAMSALVYDARPHDHLVFYCA